MVTYEPDLRRVLVRDDAPSSAYWITHAGGSIQAVASRMRDLADATNVDVHSLAMPARDDWFHATFDGDLNDLAAAVAGAIIDQRNRDGVRTPFTVIGHSFGSVLAYRIAGELIRREVPPQRLIVMSFPAPDRLSHEMQLHRLSDDELVEQVDVLFGGVPDDIKKDVDARAFFVPGLRFDLGLLERYQHAADTPPLPIPVTAVCGVDDRAVDMAQMQRWQITTSGDFRLVAMPGDHFFPLARTAAILKLATA
ncbi:Linear gramicidin dehydrogenase LgrE [Rubripirellula lacrimiformis]|uniref:Linear gramicidin dehydrogenase LgrE n=1 Tax=Rubripirellula lacrimiformis TaxID=1930273 RepID=A0A517NLD2_9BACT|nr:alpha/beta fold hydrolase [Rubripirellula lacrimiformis]QDT07946.1 Linear gramicidin dehydrogenase LgrE [Rubripirellula lacrimiformis]